ncbi:MAG: hypothetical protein P8R32_01885, partial [Candidatus Poseidoniia archaeon]|nr:hypothetical protein [Candidatus Poseidoniia archaeon]
HQSIKESKMEQIGVVSIICQNDSERAAEIAGNLDLNENELAILLNTDKKNKRLISIMEESQQYRQDKEVVTLNYVPKIEDKDDEEPKRIVPRNDKKQKSLFEF